MIKTLITFGLGVYTGIYVAQNYELQKVDNPAQIWEKIMKYIEEQNKKQK